MQLISDLAGRLALNEAEARLARRAVLRTSDELHARLRSGVPLPSAIRRETLLRELEELISPAYRLALEAPLPTPALTARLATPEDTPSDPVPPADWPALGRPVSLAGEAAADLLGPVPAPWPPRDQGTNPYCVPFAALACVEATRDAPGASPERRSASFLHARILAIGPSAAHGAAAGATKLTEALGALRDDGACLAGEWPDHVLMGHPPSPAAAAAARREAGARCWDLGPLPARWPGAARAVLELLRQGRPVAISLPALRDAGAGPDGPTHWQDKLAWLTGRLPEPEPAWVPAPSGHAVCVLGFDPDPEAPLGGWFIFRNSWGAAWGHGLPDAAPPLPPHVPGPGYGALSAGALEATVQEIFALA